MTLRNFELNLSVPLSVLDEYLEAIIADRKQYISGCTPAEVVELLNDIRSELILMGREQR